MKINRRVVDSTTNKPISINGVYVKNSFIYLKIGLDKFKKRRENDSNKVFQTIRVSYIPDHGLTQDHRTLIHMATHAVYGSGNVIVGHFDEQNVQRNEMDWFYRNDPKIIKVSAKTAVELLNV